MNKEVQLYQKPNISSPLGPAIVTSSRSYRGLSTVNPGRGTYNLYDIELIKQDIINNFYIRQGEKLENPAFGTIIWDVLFDPLTDDLRQAIAQNVTDIVNYDPRVNVNQINVSEYESGIQIECVLTYLPYSISEQMQLQFDQTNGILN